MEYSLENLIGKDEILWYFPEFRGFKFSFDFSCAIYKQIDNINYF